MSFKDEWDHLRKKWDQGKLGEELLSRYPFNLELKTNKKIYLTKSTLDIFQGSLFFALLISWYYSLNFIAKAGLFWVVATTIFHLMIYAVGSIVVETLRVIFDIAIDVNHLTQIANKSISETSNNDDKKVLQVENSNTDSVVEGINKTMQDLNLLLESNHEKDLSVLGDRFDQINENLEKLIKVQVALGKQQAQIIKHLQG